MAAESLAMNRPAVVRSEAGSGELEEPVRHGAGARFVVELPAFCP